MTPFFLLFVIVAGCSIGEGPPLFESLPSEQTNITFSNDLEDTPEFNILNYLYFYDGGGVSVGDINGDDLPDLYFTANMKPNRLYLNKGNFTFEDITEQAGVAGSGDWTTGTTMADVNGDGLLDIYVSNVNYLTKEGRNQLFINNGDSTFSEQAERFGLDFSGYSKQAAFFDYDMDGDLDMYLLNHAVHSRESFVLSEQRKVADPHTGDRLYRNDGERFTEVTEEAGIYSSILGYGLAISVSDLNNDGCPDMYVSNDFHENDYLYRNKCDGTFTEVLERSTGHTSRASMGNDIADVNNDGLADIYVADMLPTTEERLKSAVSSETFRVYNIQRQFGYHPQLIQNTLQLNFGERPEGGLLFSEIAQYAGVNATDWSWAPLLFDMDNSGQKDLFVTNGIYRRPNDLDYLLYVRRDSTQRMLRRAEGEMDLEVIQKMPHVEIPNAAFINRGDYRFEDRSRSLGFGQPGYSNGAAYGDLDNDGDLDLVVNNVNSEASVYQNMTREREGGDYLKIELQGDGKNSMGIGSKVMLHDSSAVQLYELYTTRGFLSSVEPALTIGLGEAGSADSLTVIWPDQRYQTLYNVEANQKLTIRKSDAANRYNYEEGKGKGRDPVFRNVTPEDTLGYSHREDAYIDFNRQKLAPFMLNSQGPGVAVGDVNGDGMEDFFVCGAKGQPGTFFLQESGVTFTRHVFPSLKEDESFEDIDAALFDANGDETLDLYVVSGGNEGLPQSRELADRLYLNDGKGNLLRTSDWLPGAYENGSTVSVADYDSDGDNDLFVGSRSIPNNYGVAPHSYLYENIENNRFEDVTDQIAPGLRETGLVTDARWEDLDGDERPDLIVVGEWMPVTIFMNREDGFIESLPASGLEETHGWWQSVETGDFDGDGDIDIVAGNMGTNSYLKASSQEPIVMYLNDFNEDGQVDPILGYTKNGKEYPVAPRDELLIPFKFLRPKFGTYKDYAGSTISEIFGSRLREGDWKKKSVTMLESVYLENDGSGRFTVHILPDKTQWAPIFAFQTGDYNRDGELDLLAGGNFHAVKPSVGGRYDGSYGWYLEGSGDGAFDIVEIGKSGFVIDGEIRDIETIATSENEQMIIVARNDKPLIFFRVGE